MQQQEIGVSVLAESLEVARNFVRRMNIFGKSGQPHYTNGTFFFASIAKSDPSTKDSVLF
jgi:hypothetical protein